MKTWVCRIRGVRYELDVGPPKIVSGFLRRLDNKPSLCIVCIRRTQHKNIIWVRWTSLTWSWPPIKTIGRFTDPDEE